MKETNETRREFLSRTAAVAFAIPLSLSCRSHSIAQVNDSHIVDAIRKKAINDPNSNWTGAIDAPENVTWKTALAGKNEPGERIKISGTVYEADRRTPAANVLIYLYHTDIEGIYGREGEPNHGRFRGWLLTDERGRYEFSSLKPGSYPNGRNPAHIHMTLTTIDRREDWIDSILFAGDNFITADMRAVKRGGFNPILKLRKNMNDVLTGVRNIQL